jgi:DNA-binding transcriptional LysR family regulator
VSARGDRPRRFRSWRAAGAWLTADRPLLAEFAARHPALELHLASSEGGLQVGGGGLDVAIRIDRPDDPAVITRKIASVKRIVCAAPSYRAARGAPRRPTDLAAHECLRLACRHACSTARGSAPRPAWTRSRSTTSVLAAAATFCTRGGRGTGHLAGGGSTICRPGDWSNVRRV